MTFKETNDAINNLSHIGVQKFADERIQEDCMEALYRCQQIDATDIQVAVVNGMVELSGFAESQDAIRVAQSCIEGIKGIITVHNNLQLRQIAKDQLS